MQCALVMSIHCNFTIIAISRTRFTADLCDIYMYLQPVMHIFNV